MDVCVCGDRAPFPFFLYIFRRGSDARARRNNDDGSAAAAATRARSPGRGYRGVVEEEEEESPKSREILSLGFHFERATWLLSFDGRERKRERE